MKVISVAGISGGVGATTVAAQLAECLVTHNQRVIALDFSQHNALRLHFGMPWNDGGGIVPQILADKPWLDASYRSKNGVNFLPFGKTTPQCAAAFTAHLTQDPEWLLSGLQELAEANDTYIIIDCPHTEYPIYTQVYSVADMVITVLGPDTLSYATFSDPSSNATLANEEKKVVYLLNGFDSTRYLDRDIAHLLRVTPNKNLCPVVIHRDELVREALANKISINDYAPYSQAAADFIALTIWGITTLSHSNYS